jgi:hypothetical protein
MPPWKLLPRHFRLGADTPVVERARVMFRYRLLIEDVVRLAVRECVA